MCLCVWCVIFIFPLLLGVFCVCVWVYVCLWFCRAHTAIKHVLYRLAYAIVVSVSKMFPPQRDITNFRRAHELWLGRLFIGLFSLDFFFVLFWSAIVGVWVCACISFRVSCSFVLCQLQRSSLGVREILLVIVLLLLQIFFPFRSIFSLRANNFNRIMNFMIICAHACVFVCGKVSFTSLCQLRLITFDKIDK